MAAKAKLMRVFMCLGFIGSFFFWRCSAYIPQRIPIGVIISSDDQAELTAISLAFYQHERNQTTHLPLTPQLEVEKLRDNNHLHLNQAVCRLINKGVFAILALSDPQTFPTLASYSNNFHQPLISPSFPEVPRDMVALFGINIRPNTIRAVLDLMRFYHWNSVIYLFDSDDGPETLQRILQLAASVLKVEVVGMERIRNVEEAQAYLRDLETRRRDVDKNIILNTSPSLARDIIVKHVHDIHVSKRNYHFVLMEPVSEDFWRYHSAELGATNVTGLQMINPQSPTFKYFMETWVRLPPEQWAGAGRNEVSLTTLFSYDAAQVVFETLSRLQAEVPQIFMADLSREKRQAGRSKDKCNPRLLPQWQYGNVMSQYLKQTHIPRGITGNVQFDNNGERQGFTLDILKTVPLGQIKIGSWSDTSGLQIERNSYEMLPESASRIDDRKTYIVTSILLPPYLMMKDSNGKEEYEGFCKDLMDSLAKDMKISYRFRLVLDGNFGMFQESTRQWDGMIGELLSGKADLAFAPLTITNDRLKVVDFSVPFQTAGISLMVKKPTRLGSSAYFFLQSFSKDLWICTVASCFILSLLLFVMSHFTGIPDDIQSASSRIEKKFSIFSSLWFIGASSLLRDSAIYPRSASTRVVSGAWWFCSLMLLALYLANMAAIILVNSTRVEDGPHLELLASRSIESVLKEAVTSGSPEVHVISPGATLKYFKDSMFPLHKNYWQHVMDNGRLMVSSVEEGVNRVRQSQGDSVFLLESPLNAHISRQLPCDTISLSGTLNNRGYGIATPFGSPLRDTIDSVLWKKIESKEVEKLYKKWWVDKNECVETKSGNKKEHVSSSVTMSDFASLFYFFVVAILLVSAVALGQRFFTKRREKNKRDLETDGITLGETPLPLPEYPDDLESLPPPPDV